MNLLPLTTSFQQSLDRILESEMVSVDDLKVFHNKESFEPLLKMIVGSKKYFYMNVLAFSCDSTTEKMVQLIETKAKAGVDVRLIINKAYSYLALPCMNRLKEAGVKITKMRTHASYFLNDQQELLIGAQSVAWMFFEADGFNDLDRDLMLYAKGALATDAYRDYISLWTEENEGQGENLEKNLAHYESLRAVEIKNNLRGNALYKNEKIVAKKLCRFSSEYPKLGIKDNQRLWKELIKVSQHTITFSGVKVETQNGEIGQLLKEKSLNGIHVDYIGNGFEGGDGELTMELVRWMKEHPSLGSLLNALNEWDKKRVYKTNSELYTNLKEDSKINVLNYFNFIHYKTWLFDYPGFFIGSANLDESKFNVVSEAGVYCLDSEQYLELQAYLERDKKNSKPFGGSL